MLKTRVITAVFLLAAFLFALFYLPPMGWLGFVTVIAAVAAWEWGALMRLGASARIWLALILYSGENIWFTRRQPRLRR